MPVEVVTHLLIYHVSEYWRCNLLFHCGEPLLSLVTFTWDLLQSHSLSSPTLECHWKVPWWWVLGVGGGCIWGGGCAPLATKGSSVVVGAPSSSTAAYSLQTSLRKHCCHATGWGTKLTSGKDGTILKWSEGPKVRAIFKYWAVISQNCYTGNSRAPPR